MDAEKINRGIRLNSLDLDAEKINRGIKLKSLVMDAEKINRGIKLNSLDMDAEKIELNRGLKYKVSVDIVLPKYQVQCPK